MARINGYAVPPGKSLVEKMWEIVDDSFESRSDEVVRAQAELLALFMVPHFRTADEIVTECRARSEARRAGKEPETFGLGTLRTLFKDDIKGGKK